MTREQKNAYQRTWYANKMATDPEFAERERAKSKRYYDGKGAEKKAEYQRENKDKRNEGNRRRKAREKGATDIEPFTKQEVWERDNGLCGICLGMADEGDWHLDHVIPLSKGGQHTFDNVQVSHPLCNLQKGNKIIPLA